MCVGRSGSELLLRLGRCRGGWFGCSRLGSRRSWSARTRLDGIGLVIKANNVLRDVDLLRSIEERRILAGRIQYYAEAVLTGVAVQDINHFAADALENILLRGA